MTAGSFHYYIYDLHPYPHSALLSYLSPLMIIQLLLTGKLLPFFFFLFFYALSISSISIVSHLTSGQARILLVTKTWSPMPRRQVCRMEDIAYSTWHNTTFLISILLPLFIYIQISLSLLPLIFFNFTIRWFNSYTWRGACIRDLRHRWWRGHRTPWLHPLCR